jgi:hypothetical protein
MRQILAVALLGFTTACATIEPEPCTSAWVEWKTKQVVRPFVVSNRGDLRDLKDAAQYLDGESRFGALKIARAVQALQSLSESFVDDVVPEIELAAEQCGRSPELMTVFIDMLEDEGVSDRVIDWARALTILMPEAPGPAEI